MHSESLLPFPCGEITWLLHKHILLLSLSLVCQSLPRSQEKKKALVSKNFHLSSTREMKKNKYPWCKQTFLKATILTLSIHMCRKITRGKFLVLIWNQLVMPRVGLSDSGKPLSLFHNGANCIQKHYCWALGWQQLTWLNDKQLKRTEVRGRDKVLTLQH